MCDTLVALGNVTPTASRSWARTRIASRTRRITCCASRRRVMRSAVTQRAAYSACCFAQADQAEAVGLEQIKTRAVASRQGWWYSTAWRTFNREAEMPTSG